MLRKRTLSGLSRRGRLVVASTLVIALAATGGVAAVLQQVLDLRTAWIDCAVTEAAAIFEANAIAEHCDHQVEILEERTPWRSSFANGDGTGTVDIYSTPQRTNVAGEWEAVDPTLAVAEDGEDLDVASPVFDMELSNGGSTGDGDPLGTITREEEFFKIGFPIDLPTPTVEGRRAIYDLADGVRLASTVNSDTTGFNSVVELRDPAAAARFFDLLKRSTSPQQARANESGKAQIAYSAAISQGLRYDTSATGTIFVVNEEGEPRFLAATPVMWDSSTPPVEYVEGVSEVSPIDRLSAPAGNDKISRMPMTVEGDAIVITLDEAMINDPSTVWPVYVDPPYEGHGAASRAAVRTGGYNGTLWNWDNADEGRRGEGTGYCSDWNTCNTQFRQRLAYQFEGLGFIGGMSGDEIQSATFNVYGEHSATCQALGTRVWITSAIWPGMTWNDLRWEEGHGTRDEYQSRACGNQGWKAFDIVGVMKKVADYNGNQITLGLKPDDDSTMNTWKRFMRDAHISLTYNRKPDAPSSLQLTQPAVTTCVTGTSRPAIANTRPTLSAISSDPDGGNVSTKFEVRLVTSSTISWNSGWPAAQASGNRASATITTARTNGSSYAWRAITKDDAGQETASGWCEFKVDTTKPASPAVQPYSSSNADAVYEEGKERGAVSRRGFFRFLNNGASDVTAYRYGFNDPSVPNTATVSSTSTDGSSTVSFTPTVAGPVVLYVQSRDGAGNLSPAMTYRFDVGAAVEDIVWTFDEGTGVTSFGDSERSADKTLYLNGPSWVDGPHALFGSRAGDKALHFDGVDDSATAPAVIDARSAYAVSLHVQLDPGTTGLGKNYTAVKQTGAQRPAFDLGYRSSCGSRAAETDKGCWAFTTYSNFGARPVTTWTAESALPATPGQWVHLVVAWDPSTRKNSIWQCDVGTPDAPSLATPTVRQATGDYLGAEAANSLVIGESWPGSIDNVRIFKGRVVEGSKIRRICQGAEASDFNDRNISLDPTEPLPTEAPPQ